MIIAVSTMSLEQYLESYLKAEHSLRELHGDFTYYSKPTIYEGDNGELIAVAPWGEYSGDPLVLPHNDYVDYIAITTINAEEQMETMVRYLADVVKLLGSMYPVAEIESPVKHITVRLPIQPEVSDQLHTAVMQLPEVNS